MPRVHRPPGSEILPLTAAMPLLETGIDKYLDEYARDGRKVHTEGDERRYGEVYWQFDGVGRMQTRRRLGYASVFGEGLLTICRGWSWDDETRSEAPPAEYSMDAAGETLSWHAGALTSEEVQLTMAGLLFPANPECTTEFVIALQSAKRFD